MYITISLRHVAAAGSQKGPTICLNPIREKVRWMRHGSMNQEEFAKEEGRRGTRRGEWYAFKQWVSCFSFPQWPKDDKATLPLLFSVFIGASLLAASHI